MAPAGFLATSSNLGWFVGGGPGGSGGCLGAALEPAPGDLSAAAAFTGLGCGRVRRVSSQRDVRTDSNAGEAMRVRPVRYLTGEGDYARLAVEFPVVEPLLYTQQHHHHSRGPSRLSANRRAHVPRARASVEELGPGRLPASGSWHPWFR